MIAGPELFILRRCDWQFFATLTFADVSKKGVRVEWGQVRTFGSVFAFLRKVAEISGCKFRDLRFAIRLERGELNQRYHYHVLLGGLPCHRTDPRHAGVLKNLWASSLGFGHADVRCWDGRDAVAYIADSAENWSYNGANRYELGKFGASDVIVMSKSLVHERQRDVSTGCPTTALNRSTPEKTQKREVVPRAKIVPAGQLPGRLTQDGLQIRAMFRGLSHGLGTS